VALVEMVKAGTIHLQARCDSVRGIAGWIFEIDQVRALQLRLNHGRSNWLSIPEAAKALSIKQQVAYWLAQNGFLAAEKLGTIKGIGSRIHREEFERFKKCHIFCREIAARTGRSSRKVRQLLEARGVYPLHGESAEPCRMLVYAYCDELQRFLDEIDKPQEEFRLVGDVADYSHG